MLLNVTISILALICCDTLSLITVIVHFYCRFCSLLLCPSDCTVCLTEHRGRPPMDDDENEEALIMRLAKELVYACYYLT